jgi:hypothetical protein
LGSPRVGGRQPGTPNRTTAEVAALAREHTAECIAELARIAMNSKSEETRLRAIDMLLDRGHGRPAQSHMLGGLDGGAVVVAHHTHSYEELKHLPPEELIKRYRATIASQQ